MLPHDRSHAPRTAAWQTWADRSREQRRADVCRASARRRSQSPRAYDANITEKKNARLNKPEDSVVFAIHSCHRNEENMLIRWKTKQEFVGPCVRFLWTQFQELHCSCPVFKAVARKLKLFQAEQVRILRLTVCTSNYVSVLVDSILSALLSSALSYDS